VQRLVRAGELGLLDVGLRTDRNEFVRRHRRRAGDKAGIPDSST
jgi:hypothetical protein